MSVSSYDYTPEDVYVMAKYTRKRISCEWQNCPGPTFLNCWHTFEKHIRQHCLSSKNDLGQHVCQYRACSARLHISQAELLTHVLSSHFTRIPILCPVGDCEWTFHRPTQLEVHLERDHEDDYNPETRLLRINPTILKPSCRPFKPPPITLQPLPRSKLVRNLIPLPIKLPQHQHLPHNTYHSSKVSSYGNNTWGYISNLRAEEEAERNEEDYQPPTPLSLRPIRTAELTEAGAALVVRPTPPEHSQLRLSRPVLIPVKHTVPELPPRMIGFETHRRNALKAAGLPLDSEPPSPRASSGRLSREDSDAEYTTASRSRSRKRGRS